MGLQVLVMRITLLSTEQYSDWPALWHVPVPDDFQRILTCFSDEIAPTLGFVLTPVNAH